MFPPQAHGPEQDVEQHLLRGSEQFAFGLVDDSFETRAVRDARRRLRPSSPRASRLHPAAVHHGRRRCHGSRPGEACSQGQRTQSCSLVARLPLTVQLPGQLQPTWNKRRAPWRQVNKKANAAQRLPVNPAPALLRPGRPYASAQPLPRGLLGRAFVSHRPWRVSGALPSIVR